MSDFIDELKRRRAEALSQVEFLNQQIAALDVLIRNAAIEAARQPLSVLPPPPPAQAPESATVPQVSSVVPAKRPGRFDGPEWEGKRAQARRQRQGILGACIEHLETVDHPVKRDDLLDALVAKGVSIPSFRPHSYLSTLLWQARDRVVSFHHLGYWLANRPYPDIGFMGKPGEAHPRILARPPS